MTSCRIKITNMEASGVLGDILTKTRCKIVNRRDPGLVGTNGDYLFEIWTFDNESLTNTMKSTITSELGKKEITIRWLDIMSGRFNEDIPVLNKIYGTRLLFDYKVNAV